MAKNEEDTGSPGWGASFFMQTTEDVSRAVAAAATAMNSPRPSVVFSSKENGGDSPMQRLQRQFAKVLKGFSEPSETKSITYNPEVLTSQKRQWAKFQLQYLDHKPLNQPSKLFESMVVLGLHPDCDIQALQRQYIARRSEGSGRLRSVLSYPNHSRVEPSLEPQVLFVYPPEKKPPLNSKDLLSFCFPGGVEVNAVEKTPSMSELNEIYLSQEHLKPSDLSFVFRLQVADNSTLYGCCVLVEEIVQRPSKLLPMVSDKQPTSSYLRRHILTTRRCYCILTRLPFFELHFGVLNSIFIEERLERLMNGIGDIGLDIFEDYSDENNSGDMISHQDDLEDSTEASSEVSQPDNVGSNGNYDEGQKTGANLCLLNHDNENKSVVPINQKIVIGAAKAELDSAKPEIIHSSSPVTDDISTDKQVIESCSTDPSPLLLGNCQHSSSDPGSSFQASPSESRHFRTSDTETEEASFSGQEDSSHHTDILEWAKVENNGSLQILSEYYQLQCPSRGSALTFHPLEHLHPLEYHRPDETFLYTAGSTIDLRSCCTSLQLAEAHSALLAEEEAAALSTWAVASLCGSLRLENVLTILAGALLEKQIVFVCSNLGILSASVLSIIPLIRPYQWQSLLMPILPDDMLDFLDAPVPYIVGVKNKTSEVQSKLTNVIVVDVNKNQMKSSSIPQLPRHKELYASLSPYHAKLVGESYLARRRPVYECTDIQVEAAKGFLTVLRTYLDSLCSNLRSHTITNVQSNNDKVSLLLKDSFIESFPYRHRPFMKLFVDTQLFSVHTDLVLSFFQKL